MHPLKQKRTQFTNTNRDPKKKKKGRFLVSLNVSFRWNLHQQLIITRWKHRHVKLLIKKIGKEIKW